MSRWINGRLRLREWYAVKHALEFTIQNKEANEKDKEQEKKIVDQVVDIISKYQRTKEHYSDDNAGWGEVYNWMLYKVNK